MTPFFGNQVFLNGIAWSFMGFNGIIWDENRSQSYPQPFVYKRVIVLSQTFFSRLILNVLIHNEEEILK
jgi:hypothetical protein